MPAPVDLVELSAFKASTLQWRPNNSAPVMTIVAKTTYKLAPGIAELAEMQDDVNKRALHAENNPKKGLHSASDLAPYKPRADVTVVGKAYSPPRELSRMVVARVKVGKVDKRVQVHADRFLENGRIKDDKFFSKMGIGYERAFGGPNTANPVGVGIEGRPDSRGRVKLPNLQAPGSEIMGPNAKRRPYAFGPIPPTWPSRHRLLNGASMDFLHGDDPLSQEVPATFHWSFFNVGPPDQQLDEIRADQTIHLEHLHPEEPQLDIQLPGYYPCVYVQRADEAFRVQMKGDTLWIDTNRLVLTVTWRAQVTLEGDPNAPVRVLVALGRPEFKPTWDQVWAEAEAQKARDAWAHKVQAEAPPSRQPRKSTDVIDAPYSHRGVTSPVPLRAPGSDRHTSWLPAARASGPGQASVSSPGFSGPPPSSNPAELVVEVGLADGDVQRLRDLCNATGFNATEMLRQALREAHKARFGGG